MIAGDHLEFSGLIVAADEALPGGATLWAVYAVGRTERIGELWPNDDLTYAAMAIVPCPEGHEALPLPGTFPTLVDAAEAIKARVA